MVQKKKKVTKNKPSGTLASNQDCTAYKISFAILFVIIAVALIVQIIVVVPMLLLNLSATYSVSPHNAIMTILTQLLLFLIFLGALGVACHKYHANCRP